jgi:hypothetical protein
MTSEAASTPAATRLAAKVQAFAEALADDERAILATIIEQAAAHPDAVVGPADGPEVTGFDGSVAYFGIGLIGPLPPPPGGVGVGGSGLVYYYLRYY